MFTYLIGILAIIINLSCSTAQYLVHSLVKTGGCFLKFQRQTYSWYSSHESSFTYVSLLLPIHLQKPLLMVSAVHLYLGWFYSCETGLYMTKSKFFIRILYFHASAGHSPAICHSSDVVCGVFCCFFSYSSLIQMPNECGHTTEPSGSPVDSNTPG